MYGMTRFDQAIAGVFADLDGDGVDEFVLLRAGGGPVYQFRSGYWEHVGRLYSQRLPSSWPALAAQLAMGRGRSRVTTVSRWPGG